MLVFGSINLPLPELFLILVMLFFVFLVMIVLQLQKLSKMTEEEQKELAELEKLAQEEKKDLEQIKSYEQMEKFDLSKFEQEIKELEEETDTLYLKKLAPDLYKLQNYTLWALKKGMTPSQIKENLLSKGWKDHKLMDMIITDTLKYQGYYKDKKGDVLVPEIKIEETTKIMKPVKVVKVEKTRTTTTKKVPVPKSKKKLVKKKSVKKRSASKKLKVPKSSFDDI